MPVVLRLLGEVRAEIDGRPVDLGSPRQRCVLAALAVDVGQSVSVDRLAERVWGADAAPRTRATLHSYISRLRRALAEMDGVAIVRRTGSYALLAETVDLQRFRELCARARGADEVPLLTEALELWRGDALTGVDGEWVRAERERLEQERLAAEHDLVDARLRAGDGVELIVELSARAARHPLDERVAGQYLLALHRAGRTTDALEHYRQVRALLVEELGADPGTALQELHQQILAADPRLDSAPAAAVVPRQLPAAPSSFVGRLDALHCLDDATSAGTVVISAVSGAGGIGKTSLALHWAHANADRFPDGQLFADLHGFSPTSAPASPIEVLGGFLDALGVGRDRQPGDLDRRADLYRSLIADRRMLIVLDNAATADHVVPLLPGSPACTVLVTGRTRLASVIDRYGARHVPLDVLTRAEARALLAARLGDRRVGAEPGVTDELIELCGRFPLALAITARHAATRPRVPLAELAAELRELGLEVLDHDTDPTASLPAVLSWSLRHLTEQQRVVFALLAIAPGPDIDVPAAASLAGLSEANTRKTLRALEEHSLLDAHPHGRYAMHDLIRAYATTLAHDLPEPVRDAALERVVDFYLHTAHAADRLLSPHRPTLLIDPPADGTRPLAARGQPEGLAWLDAHHAHLLAAQAVAAGRDDHQAVCHLAWCLDSYYHRRGLCQGQLSTWTAALAAAEHLDDTAMRVRAHRNLGNTHSVLAQHDLAVEHLERALVLAEAVDDWRLQGLLHLTLANAWDRCEDHTKAFAHASRGLELHQNHGYHTGAVHGHLLVGWNAARMGDYSTAVEHCQAALDMYARNGGDADIPAAVQDCLGYVAHHTGHHHESVERYEQSIALRHRTGHTYMEALTLEAVGHPYIALGRHRQARAVWEQALKLYRQHGQDADADRMRHQLDDLDNTRRFA
ncbi:winged helix-turn-helix domain-containing protein [Allokutzneria sp. A3M-2-11 16]|uniref:AfsR/SARP family transcriptional regulator n=1 Tax=Allokutzneria sp. A3M-2-11 16 TaxID=2962043 RepID=UPI0020B6EAB0|nr:BTAD domain-containing putative transcriptional regulator [Allokutzneria sp. A3M-2-11 16]MCP3803374.1 winged helix-turn-helix domain-containing protein [Allokutzneria sp. A3M-2-11 16]